MVKMNNRMAVKFKLKEVVRQGDSLSPILFSIVLEKSIIDANINRACIL